MEDKELVEEVITEEASATDQEEDFSPQIIKIRKSVRFRMPFILMAITAYSIVLRYGNYSDFNPINNPIFIALEFLVIILCIAIYLFDYQEKKDKKTDKITFKRYKLFSDTLDFLSVVPYLMLVITIINSFFISFSPISGSSMEPNFSDNESVLFNHLVSEYERFDVIIVDTESGEDQYLIKRVIGLPGEVIEINRGVIYIDGVVLDDSLYIDHDAVSTICTTGADPNYCMWIIPEASYFVLGDNRDGHAVEGEVTGSSRDSRLFGPVSEDDICGKVFYTFKDKNFFN